MTCKHSAQHKCANFNCKVEIQPGNEVFIVNDMGNIMECCSQACQGILDNEITASYAE